MNFTRFMSLFAAGLVLSLVASGCKHRPPPVTNLPQHGSSGTLGNPGTGGTIGGPGASGQDVNGTPMGIPSNPAGSHDGWTPMADVLQTDTVHFEFDSSAIPTEEESKVAAVADYLKANAGNAVRIEGHCDERGTEEYNRALGERRALALREALARLSVEPSRVDTVSFGKDRPKDQGHEESAWKQNRRGEFIVLVPPK